MRKQKGRKAMQNFLDLFMNPNCLKSIWKEINKILRKKQARAKFIRNQ